MKVWHWNLNCYSRFCLKEESYQDIHDCENTGMDGQKLIKGVIGLKTVKLVTILKGSYSYS